tara:strand:+ start:6933 stop:7163 length:231 start_codon:yes stop_codon:yes gene_type:complete
MTKTTRTFIVGKRGEFSFQNDAGDKVTRQPGDLIPEAASFDYRALKTFISTGAIENCVVLDRTAKATKKGKTKQTT